MFWTDWGEEPKIERAEMDGSNRLVIVQQEIHWPNGLTIDYRARKIYWTDAKLYYIKRSGYDGSQSMRILTSPSQCTLGHPFALTLYKRNVYWTDWKTRGIYSTNKKSGFQCLKVWSNAYSPMDIHVFHPKRQKPRPGKFFFLPTVIGSVLKFILPPFVSAHTFCASHGGVGNSFPITSVCLHKVI